MSTNMSDRFSPADPIEFKRIVDALSESVLHTSDEEIYQETGDDGDNRNEAAETTRGVLLNALSSSGQARSTAIKQEPSASVRRDYWDSLFIPLQKYLVRSLVRTGGAVMSASDAADYADGIIIKLYQNWDAFRLPLETSSNDERRHLFHAYLWRAVQLAVKDHLRKQRSEGVTLAVDTAIHKSPPFAASVVNAAIARLSPEDQRLLHAHTAQGMTFSEIGKQLCREGKQVTDSSLTRQYYRAIQELRSYIEKELLTGTRPYSFANRSTAAIAVCESAPPLPSSIGGEHLLRGDLDAILLKALGKETELRYSSGQSFSDDLDHHVEALPVKAARAGIAYRLAKFGRRNRAAVLAGTGLMLSLLAVLIGTAWQARVANRERAAAQHELGRALEEARNANLQRTLVEQSVIRAKELAEASAAEARLQRNLAIAARQSADARFEDIRKLSTSFLFEFEAAISNVNGTLKARELVVAKGLEYLEKLSRESGPSSDSLNEELAVAYERLGGIQGNIYQPNLGRLEQAAASYEKALALRRLVLARNPGNGSMRIALANSHIRLAEGLFTSGNLTATIEHHQAGIRMLEDVAGKGASQTHAADPGLYRSHSRLCTLLLGVGDSSGALQHCETARQVSARMLARQPVDPVLRANAAAAHAGTGTALRVRKSPREAIRLFEQAALEFENLSAEFPQNNGYGRNLAGTYTQLGAAWSDAGNKENAIDYQQKSIATLRRMLKSAPHDVRLQTTLGLTSIRLASVLLSLSRPEEALAAGREGLEVFRSLADRPEATPNDLNNYASLLLEIGVPSLRDPKTALAYSTRAGVKTPNVALMRELNAFDLLPEISTR